MWVLRFVVCGQSGFWVLLLILEQLQLVVFISDFKHLLSDWNPDNFNPLAPNLPFLYPLKISEILTVFWCFQGVEKGCIGKELVNTQLLRCYFPTGIYVFRIENGNRTIFKNLLNLKSIVTQNRSQTFFCCFHCWLWTGKCRLGENNLSTTSKKFQWYSVVVIFNIINWN